ncbi:MAG TPA: fibronectin type III domain-containing protein [Terriglobales bacterium]|nr:fibronectin type III domain-containing protein [Terriglobales bacterium]
MSNEVALVVPTGNGTTCPSAPRNLASSVSGNNATLTWIAPTAGVPTSYVIQAGSQPGGAELANFDTNSNTTNLIASNVPAGSYYVRVYGKNTCGLSAPSNEMLMVVQ